MTAPESAARADIVGAWATGIGIGTMVFMLTWLVANRVTGLFMEVPQAPITAMALAVTLGTAVSAWQGRRLARLVRSR